MGFRPEIDMIFLSFACQWPLTGDSGKAYKDTDESVLPADISGASMQYSVKEDVKMTFRVSW